jgi:hypothetical protein
MNRPADELAARSFRRSRLVDAVHGPASPSWTRPLVTGLMVAVLGAGVAAGPELLDRLQTGFGHTPTRPSAPDR